MGHPVGDLQLAENPEQPAGQQFAPLPGDQFGADHDISSSRMMKTMPVAPPPPASGRCLLCAIGHRFITGVAVEVEIDHRRQVQSQDLREQQPADDG